MKTWKILGLGLVLPGLLNPGASVAIAQTPEQTAAAKGILAKAPAAELASRAAQLVSNAPAREKAAVAAAVGQAVVAINPDLASAAVVEGSRRRAGGCGGRGGQAARFGPGHRRHGRKRARCQSERRAHGGDCRSASAGRKDRGCLFAGETHLCARLGAVAFFPRARGRVRKKGGPLKSCPSGFPTLSQGQLNASFKTWLVSADSCGGPVGGGHRRQGCRCE